MSGHDNNKAQGVSALIACPRSHRRPMSAMGGKRTLSSRSIRHADLRSAGRLIPVADKRESTMGEAELIGIIRDSNVQYASLFGQMVTINFAMIVAIYYFLHRASLKLKLAAFAFYLIGMLSLIGLMLTEANLKYFAIRSLATIPMDHLSSVGAGYLAFRTSWLAVSTMIFMNVSMWVLIAVIVYLLFWWRDDRREEGTTPPVP
jgi:hypothetical protein